MERGHRDFKGIWIPKEIWLSAELSLMEKVLFVEIHSLDNERGCFASNAHFAQFFGVSDRQIRTYLASLRSKGFINITLHENHERIIRAAGKFARVPDTEVRRMRQAQVDLVQKFSVARLTRGWKKTSGGVGRQLPPRPEGNFHRVIQ